MLHGNGWPLQAAFLLDLMAPIQAHPNTQSNNAGVAWGDKMKLST